MIAGVYIHIPFCRTRCKYCDFYSTTLSTGWQRRYVDALCREVELRAGELGSQYIHSLYIGGGTPSILPPSCVSQLFDCISRCFAFLPGAEVTIEANPDDVSSQWLDLLASTPVNRISMGVQTFSDQILQFLGRRHTSSQALEAVSLCRRAGYDNISIDLMYGLPFQTMEQWRLDVGKALELEVPHLSAYSLTYEEGTPLASMLERGEVVEASDEESWEMYRYLVAETSHAGMEHYEISNFCLPGKRSRHNSGYWKGMPYLGVGAGAHSYDGKRIRRANDADVLSYLKANGDAPHTIETLTDDELYDELVLTRLRTSDGLLLDLLDDASRRYCLKMAKPHLRAGRLSLKDGRLALTEQGMFVSNDIISDIMR